MLQEPGEHSGRLTPEELEKVEMMHKYVLSNAHFYCETADISRPFPSSRPVDQPSWEFVWNRWLSAPFRSVDLPTHCPHLMQVFGVLSDKICLSVLCCLSLCASICLSVCLSLCLFTYLSSHLSCLAVAMSDCKESACRTAISRLPQLLTQCGQRVLAAPEHVPTQNSFRMIARWASPKLC